jgi:FKBP-type peptidyl-prolyl cis-trans isomerase
MKWQMMAAGAMLASASLMANAQDTPAAAPAPAPEAAAPAPAASNGLDTVMDRVSYGIGMDIGRNLKKSGIEIKLETFMAGLTEALEGKPARLSDQEFRATMMQLRQEMMAKAEAEAKVAGEAAGKAGADYLAANAKKEGVTTTASGLQYKMIEAGEGATPKETDTVTVHYTGRLVDGTVFDSSVQRGEPATFPLNGVIPGWTEALQLMKVGSKYEIAIPASLAYGERGAPPVIPPNSTLVFEVQLLKIEAPAPAPAPGEAAPAPQQ